VTKASLVAVAIFATALGLAPVAPTGAQTPVDFAKLTVRQRLALTGATVVQIAGRRYTLRGLQQQHAARVARFALAASNGSAAGARLASLGAGPNGTGGRTGSDALIRVSVARTLGVRSG
jgi:hypothetical protein